MDHYYINLFNKFTKAISFSASNHVTFLPFIVRKIDLNKSKKFH